jgi:hypothetical protein
MRGGLVKKAKQIKKAKKVTAKKVNDTDILDYTLKLQYSDVGILIISRYSQIKKIFNGTLTDKEFNSMKEAKNEEL